MTELLKQVLFDTTSSVKPLQICMALSQTLPIFENIFGNNIANELVSDNTWKQLIQLNVFLSSLNIEGVVFKSYKTYHCNRSHRLCQKENWPDNFDSYSLIDLVIRLTIK